MEIKSRKEGGRKIKSERSVSCSNSKFDNSFTFSNDGLRGRPSRSPWSMVLDESCGSLGLRLRVALIAWSNSSVDSRVHPRLSSSIDAGSEFGIDSRES